jgi:hypothetical protein
MMIAAINAGLEQQFFTLDVGDNRWVDKNPIYRFTIGTMPAIACVGDAGFGELIFHVAAKPTRNAEEWIRADNAFFLAGPICALPEVLRHEVQPRGYLAEGRLMM